ncbi:MAG: alpha-galactosidase [Proteobacteria bacterium]|nr:alpha-galactosidase [Pseudomonadota bacterium]
MRFPRHCARRPLAPAARAIASLLAGLVAWSAAQSEPLMRAPVGTATTSIVVEAGPDAPRFTRLALRGGAAWDNRAWEHLPAEVTIDGRVVPLAWRWDSAASRRRARDVDLVYRARTAPLEAHWLWSARAASGPLEHEVRVCNRGPRAVDLPLLASLQFDFAVAENAALRRFWVEKGGDHPSDVGTHDEPLGEGDAWQGRSSTYARPLAGEPPEMIPYVLVHRADGEADGWYVGIEFSGRTRITVQRAGAAVRGEAGLDPQPGPYRTRVPPGGCFTAPTVFLGAARGGADGAGNQLRRWVRGTLAAPRTLADPSFPLLVSNSWGSGLEVDESLARRMIDEAQALGLELYHLDAGWFRGVGDWRADPAKFPHGIAAIADYAHRRGLRFGLWADWTQAGTADAPGALRVDDRATRDWLVADPPPGWQHREPFKGVTIDLGVPAARAWAAREVERIVTDYHLDMLEHDGYLVAQGSARAGHPALPPDPGTLRVYEDSGYLWADGSNETDVSYHATLGYYAIQQQLRRRHPHLLLEVCNDGGRMVDFGSAAHGDYFSITDHYDPLSNRRAFYDASFVLPPAMLEAYVERWPTPRLANLRYLLRSGMMGWFSLMLDTTQWSGAERAAARAELALYKARLRPLIRSADLYHVTPRPDGQHWDGIEYYAPAGRHGVLFAFRGAAADETVHRFRLAALERGRRYRISFHDQGPEADIEVSGATLMDQGLAVTLPEPLSSELVFISATS